MESLSSINVKLIQACSPFQLRCYQITVQKVIALLLFPHVSWWQIQRKQQSRSSRPPLSCLSKKTFVPEHSPPQTTNSYDWSITGALLRFDYFPFMITITNIQTFSSHATVTRFKWSPSSFYAKGVPYLIPTPNWSWFPNLGWRVRCRTHRGWNFLITFIAFFGPKNRKNHKDYVIQ